MSLASNEMPLVTVVVPSYNHSQYVARTIESVAAQSYGNIEVVVIDDASSDNSVDVLEDLQERFDFKLVVHIENRGLPATLNEGIMLSNGSYVCVVASDDYWPSDKIARQVAVMSEYPEVAVSYGCQEGFSDSGDIRRYSLKASEGVKENLFGELITWETTIPALTAMVRRSVYDEVGFYDESVAIEDWCMWLRISKKYPFYFINETLGYYRLHENNMSKKMLWMVEEKRKILDLWVGDPCYEKALAMHNVMSFWKLSSAFKLEAVRHLFKAGFVNCLSSKYFYKGFLKLLLPARDYSI